MNKLVNLRQFLYLTAAHGKEISRQPAVLFWGVIFPILLALGLGMAFTREAETVHNIALVKAVDYDAEGKEPIDLLFDKILADLDTSRLPGQTIQWKSGRDAGDTAIVELTVDDETPGDTVYIFTPLTWEEAIVMLKRGRISMIMELSGKKEVRYHFPPANPEAQLAYLKLSSVIEGLMASLPATDRGPRTDAPAGNTGITATVSPLDVPGTRYIDFLVPGLISMGVMMSCMWGISYGMIDKRSRKLLRRMVATPMIKSHFLAALMTVRILLNVVESALLVFFTWLIFDISIQGSIPALVVVFLSGNIAFCGIAVFTSSRTANTEVGNGLINAVVIPMTLLSGIFFSYYNFPDWSIPVIEKLPLTLLVDGIRGIFTEGAGFAETAPASALLFLTGAVFFTAGLRIFKWH